MSRGQRPDLLHVSDKDEAYVYHWFNSSPSQHGDFNMFNATHDGWQPVLEDVKVPSEVLSSIGQGVSNPGGGVVRRGDLSLYRMPKEQWERTVHADTLENQKRMNTTIDTMVLQANENVTRTLRDRGQNRIPAHMVFREDVGDPTD